MMTEKLDKKRILIFLAFAFGIAGFAGLIIFLTGGLVDSLILVPNTNITLAIVLIATIYMWSPALANIITRIVTREGWQDTWLRPHFKRGWRMWVVAWIGPSILTTLGAIVFFIIFPRFFDPTLGTLRDLLAASEEQTGQAIPISVELVAIIQIAQGIILAPLINSLFAFGEEFGWRAYLQPKLMPLGGRTAILVVGIIWGVWHWPLIVMGHNYGLDYPGAGLLAIVWFTLVTGTFLGWVTLRGDSVWPAVIGHAAINGIAGIAILFIQDSPNPILGPLPTGLIGSAAWTAVAGWILLKDKFRRTAPSLQT